MRVTQRAVFLSFLLYHEYRSLTHNIALSLHSRLQWKHLWLFAIFWAIHIPTFHSILWCGNSSTTVTRYLAVTKSNKTRIQTAFKCFYNHNLGYLLNPTKGFLLTKLNLKVHLWPKSFWSSVFLLGQNHKLCCFRFFFPSG